MEQCWGDGINPMAARANVAHGRGWWRPYSYPARFNSCHVAGVRNHVAQYVGGVLYSVAPSAPSLIRALSSRFLPTANWAGVRPRPFFLASELPDDTGAHGSDAHETGPRLLDERTGGNGPLSEIFRQCLISRKPSQTLKHVDSSWFHCRRWELTGEESACVQEGFANL